MAPRTWRLSASTLARLFFIGEGKTIQTDGPGTLYLGINDWHVSDNGGAFVVDVSATTRAYDAAAQFSGTDNPSGVWSYGCTESLGAAFQLTQPNTPQPGVYQWGLNPCPVQLGYNSTSASITRGTVLIPSHTMFLVPAPRIKTRCCALRLPRVAITR